MTQSGGQAAGIQLQVGLDLAFFRNQLPKLGATAKGYPLTFKVKFDRRSIQNELNALGTNIKKRNYFLEVTQAHNDRQHRPATQEVLQ